MPFQGSLHQTFQEGNEDDSRKIHQSEKIEKAQILLFSGNLSVKDIAYTLSFNNVSYFNRLFKSFVGCTPVEYKNEQGTLMMKMQEKNG